MNSFVATFVVSSESSEKLHLARRLVADKLHADVLFTDVATAKDIVNVRHLKIGDFFSSVRVADGGPNSFRLVFAPYPDADLYWKDMVVKILKSIRSPGVLIRSEK